MLPALRLSRAAPDVPFAICPLCCPPNVNESNHRGQSDPVEPWLPPFRNSQFSRRTGMPVKVEDAKRARFAGRWAVFGVFGEQPQR
jgi:hypothetical protein